MTRTWCRTPACCRWWPWRSAPGWRTWWRSASGALASLVFAKARAATIRRALIAVAGRAARHGRGHLTVHLPEGWHCEQEWLNLWEAACGPPAPAA
jgi:hypothetical protein